MSKTKEENGWQKHSKRFHKVIRNPFNRRQSPYITRGTAILQNLSSLLCIIAFSGLLRYLLINDKGNTIQLAGLINKSSTPEWGAALISFLLIGLVWFLIELGIEPELEILGFRSPISSENIRSAKFVFGLHKGLLALAIFASLILLYCLPPDCNGPSILFRISENENLQDEILALPGTTKDIQHSGPMLVSVIDIGSYLDAKSASLEDELECNFEGLVTDIKWEPCYKVINVRPGLKLLVVTVRKKNCFNINTFNLTLKSQ